MSGDEDQTLAALIGALRDHVTASADGAYLTDWVVIAAGAVPDDADSTVYISECSDGPIHHRLGLVRYLAGRTEELLRDDDE